MSDLRSLLYETCIRHEPNPHPKRELDVAVPTLPLADRLPECVPQGLKWDNVMDEWWLMSKEPHKGTFIAELQAELLFIGQAVKVLAKQGWWLRPFSDDGRFVVDHGGGAPIPVLDGPLLSAFAAALHWLADEQ